MTDFAYERLIVYRKSLEFYSIAKTVLHCVPRKVAACDHLNRASESVSLNIAHASSCWSPSERIGYLGYANGSVLECAACLDVFVAKSLLTAERLEVYQIALELVAWIEELRTDSRCGADLLAKLDRTSTAIPLNIAEGNGRFGATDQARFLGIAYKSTVQTATLVDLASVNQTGRSEPLELGRKQLRRIAVMLSSLSKSIRT